MPGPRPRREHAQDAEGWCVFSEREAELNHLHWTQTEKDNALAKCRLGFRASRSKTPMLCLHAVSDEDGHPLENEDESGRRFCEYWGTIVQARIEGERPDCHETILSYVQKAPDNSCWEKDRTEFDELFAIKKNVLRVLMEFHIASTDVREAWVLDFSATPINMSYNNVIC